VELSDQGLSWSEVAEEVDMAVSEPLMKGCEHLSGPVSLP
jgi:hypothetical protein